MAKEEFFANVRNAAGFLKFSGETAGSNLDEGARNHRLEQAAEWLTPRSVEGYDPADFSDLPQEDRDALGQAVEDFLVIAREVPTTAAPTKDQVRAVLRSFRTIARVVRQLALAEWLEALRGLIDEVEVWARARGWIVKRDTRKVTDRFLGEYEAPLLLLHTIQAQLLVEPVARYIVGGPRGRVDLCLLPGYDSVALTRHTDGWYLHSDGVNGDSRKWSPEVFEDAVRRLSDDR
jgi:hypothetical protein